MIKSLNNNLVLAVDEHQEEFVLFGKGIGFKMKKGDIVDQSLVIKTFQAKDREQDFSTFFEAISPEVLTACEKIIEQGEAALNKKLNASIIVSLTDHLQSAVDRFQENQVIPENALQWEIPFLYYKEYQLGKMALEIVDEIVGIQLPKLEASFIALHFVNAQDGLESMDETLLITEITKSIVKIIQSLYDVSLNKENINYSRFVTHIRYFMNRQLHNKVLEPHSDNKLFEIIQAQYPMSYACGLMVREMLKKDYQMQIDNDEMVYLIIHIERVVSEMKTE
ncbi:PRD domain-containing protein [Candidatus Enterococcus ferrettii]|uniref:Beta-glucoside operon transcriptional antiterminator n=1 Tax=Candidatus Enterococcus ferrettii TaxID=2815324 RepID=A0ABV0ESL0_9ENTE|nr:PRD domain-containing protein [Enterococcus sp. 665A]MBO1342361.1 PRD domain-containing protein [Enterococcus sp. 665A]